MNERIRCFLLEPTGTVRIFLRRYTRNNTPDCCSANPGKYSYHTTLLPFLEEPIRYSERGTISNRLDPLPPPDDPRWPTSCTCGYHFEETDPYQGFVEPLYRRIDTGEELTVPEAPVGAMWYDPSLDQFYTPQLEHCLVVKTPDGQWTIDSQANNCGLPEDRKQEHHHCWILHGEPPNITVDKAGSLTCSAGAGSIQMGSYHGFLRDGYLT